jgi:hypothetical protein
MGEGTDGHVLEDLWIPDRYTLDASDYLLVHDHVSFLATFPYAESVPDGGGSVIFQENERIPGQQVATAAGGGGLVSRAVDVFNGG